MLAPGEPPVGGGMRFWSESAAPAGQNEAFVLMCLGSSKTLWREAGKLLSLSLSLCKTG